MRIQLSLILGAFVFGLLVPAGRAVQVRKEIVPDGQTKWLKVDEIPMVEYRFKDGEVHYRDSRPTDGPLQAALVALSQGHGEERIKTGWKRLKDELQSFELSADLPGHDTSKALSLHFREKDVEPSTERAPSDE